MWSTRVASTINFQQKISTSGKIFNEIGIVSLFGNSLFSWNWKFFAENIVDKTKNKLK